VTVSNRYFFIFSTIIISLLAQEVFAQKKGSGLGIGVTFQGVFNPADEQFLWATENKTYHLHAAKKNLYGAVVRFSNYKKIQAESGVLFGHSTYLYGDQSVPNGQDIVVNEWQMPFTINFNGPSPLRYHSYLVFQAGFLYKHTGILKRGNITQTQYFHTPALVTGVRLATELKSFGRLEYGLTYTHHLRPEHSMSLSIDDALPVQIRHIQKKGQVKASLIYFFTPRLYGWSKTRYNLAL